MGYTKKSYPLGADATPQGPVGLRIADGTLDADHKLPARAKTLEAASGADINLDALLDALDYYKADREVHAMQSVRDWTARTSAADNIWYAVAWSPTLGTVGRLVAVAWNAASNRVMYSDDGINWTAVAAQAGGWADVVWAPGLGLFVAVDRSVNVGQRVMTSPDGTTWTLRTTPADNNWFGLAWSEDLTLLVAVADTGTGNRVMTSPDGSTWTLRTSANDSPWKGVAWSPELGLFAAVALDTSNNAMYSSNGTSWTLGSAPSAQYWDVAWCAGLELFVAVGINAVATSPDGINWTARTAAGNAAWRRVAWSPELGMVVAVSNDTAGTRVMVSRDGINWLMAQHGADNNWFGITWARELGAFVAVASSGTGDRVMTSL